ncbi:MAG: hypothetical protein ACI9JL_002325 [Paracoccaceae bacterium]|jgi:hypothetical protein
MVYEIRQVLKGHEADMGAQRAHSAAITAAVVACGLALAVIAPAPDATARSLQDELQRALQTLPRLHAESLIQKFLHNIKFLPADE